MTSTLIPIPQNAEFWCDRLFHLTAPVVLTGEEFDTYWPLVSTVYTKLNGSKIQRNGEVTVQRYECRLRKSKKGGKPPPPKDPGSVKKRYGTTVRQPGLCQVRIKVTRTIEMPITVTVERLDAEEHLHDLARSREIAPSVLAIQVAAAEALKGYQPAQVMNTLKGVGTPQGSERLIAIGGAHMTRKHVQNAVARRVHRVDDRIPLNRATTLRQEIDDAISFLGEKGWLHEEFTVLDAEGAPRWGLCFAHPTRIQALKRRGYFTQFDSTNKTTTWGHNVFSFLVRNEQGIWIPGTHCVVEGENPEILALAMKTFKKWCGWEPRYVLTGEDSAVEQLAVRRAFPGPEGGEQAVEHLLCSVHTMRTLDTRFKSAADKQILNALRKALYALTRNRCLDLCREAIYLAQDEVTKNIIRTSWLDTTRKWAMYARSHSPLLQQIMSTNGVDTWHRELEARAGLGNVDATIHGIKDMILDIMQQAECRDSTAQKALNDFRVNGYFIGNCEYPEVGLFPRPVQKLLRPEVDGVMDRIVQGKEAPVFDQDLTCHCKFSRQYLLPCRHIFHLDSRTKVLTKDRWQTYVALFADRGFEVYETMGHALPPVESEERPEVESVRARSSLRLRQLRERLTQQLHAVHDMMEANHVVEAERRETVDNWMGLVHKVVEPLADVLPEDIVRHNGRPWEL